MSRLSFISIVIMSIILTSALASAQDKNQITRIARIVVDSAQLEHYNAALKEGIETAVRVEPGVLTLFAFADKDDPTHITVFEVYANADAYKSHIETAHFKKYKAIVAPMVKSLELIDVVPVAMATKSTR